MNNQQVSQVLTFYRVNFDFHDPFKFILDGNFIKLLIEREIDLHRKLQNVLTGKFRLYVTSCLLRELQLLGNDFRLVYGKAKQFKILKCSHPLEISVDKCIINNQIKQKNQEKYIVCTQDIQLRRILRHVINCPLMYFGPDQRIKFQDIHRKNMQIIQKQTRQKLLPKQNQMTPIIQYKKQQQIKQKQQQKQNRKRLAYQMGRNLRMKVARGPNPQANRKKKVREHQIAQFNKIKPNQTINEEIKTKRIRKRNKNKQTANEQPGYQ